MKLPKTFKKLYSKRQINTAIKKLGKQITEYYKDSPKLNIIALAQGGLMFAMDLIRYIDIPVEYHTCIVKSYGNEHTGSQPKMIYFPDLNFSNDRFLIVDDICDTGNSIKFVKDYLSLKVSKDNIDLCTLFVNTTKQSNINCKFVGLPTNGEWLIGYGFDEQQLYRNIPDLMYLKK